MAHEHHKELAQQAADPNLYLRLLEERKAKQREYQAETVEVLRTKSQMEDGKKYLEMLTAKYEKAVAQKKITEYGVDLLTKQLDEQVPTLHEVQQVKSRGCCHV